MQPLSFYKTNRSRFTAAIARLSLAIGITAITVFLILFSASARSEGSAGVSTALTSCKAQMVKNAGFELPLDSPGLSPIDWTTGQWMPVVHFSRDDRTVHSGAWSVSITASTNNDGWFSQQVTVEPETQYMLTGWIKTKNVSAGAGANLSLVGTWTHTEGLLGTNDWTQVSLWFNSGSNTQITIGARLGYWNGTSMGTAWFDDIRLTPVVPDGTHPSWKILVLIYNKTDAVVTDTAGVSHHMVASMTQAEVQRATLAATQFVETDIPALTSGNMIPELTIRYPDHPLSQLDAYGQAWWPSPANTASDRDPAFDSVIVIWDPRVVDQNTGVHYWIGPGAGVAAPMGVNQTYAAIIIEATGYGHRNVFKHEWGHSILFYFDALGTAPKPTVTNHANINQYVHWPTGESYVWIDETDANLIPNSIYNNQSGFTHDYYSGATATADQPTRRLGITPEAWRYGGPVTKPGVKAFPPPVITCNADITVASEPGTCSASVTLTPPTVSDGCETVFTPVATRSDGLPKDAPFSCGQTVITWRLTNIAEPAPSCQQVVTVTDGKPPDFIYTPPSVTVTTGPGATSCGAFVEDARLGSTVPGLDPVIPDPKGDVRDPSAPVQNDIISTSATYDRASLTFTINFAEHVFPPNTNDPRSLIGFIEIDSDQNPATGEPPIVNAFGPPKMDMGVDFQISLISESIRPGTVEMRSKQAGGIAIVGRVPIVFTDKSLSVIVPLALLGSDNGLVNYAVGVGEYEIGATDRAPNTVLPVTSVSVPELIAIDNCAGITISRSGVPANNFFPVGETLITYTATDVSGNATSVTQTVTVIDDTQPVISGVSASPATLWPPNQNMIDVTVSYEAADNCAILETSLSVSSNDPADGGGDWEIINAHHLRLRAARSAQWGPRVYTITITAKDIHGNLRTENVTVRVPLSNGKGKMIR